MPSCRTDYIALIWRSGNQQHWKYESNNELYCTYMIHTTVRNILLSLGAKRRCYTKLYFKIHGFKYLYNRCFQECDCLFLFDFKLSHWVIKFTFLVKLRDIHYTYDYEDDKNSHTTSPARFGSLHEENTVRFCSKIHPGPEQNALSFIKM